MSDQLQQIQDFKAQRVMGEIPDYEDKRFWINKKQVSPPGKFECRDDALAVQYSRSQMQHRAEQLKALLEQAKEQTEKELEILDAWFGKALLDFAVEERGDRKAKTMVNEAGKLKLVKQADKLLVVDEAELKKWCRKNEPMIPCSNCHGSGEVIKRSGEVKECDFCDGGYDGERADILKFTITIRVNNQEEYDEILDAITNALGDEKLQMVEFKREISKANLNRYIKAYGDEAKNNVPEGCELKIGKDKLYTLLS